MLRGAFRFHASSHTYIVGDTVVPGITAILQASGRVVGAPWFEETHRERGKAVHAAALALDFGDEPAPLPADWQPYLDAYVKFREAVKPRWREMEFPRVERHLGFAGTPDRVGEVNGYPCVLEIKTGEAAAWHALQTAGQDLLLGKVGTRRRLAVYLSKLGRYALREHTAALDYTRFLQALNHTTGHMRGLDA